VPPGDLFLTSSDQKIFGEQAGGEVGRDQPVGESVADVTATGHGAKLGLCEKLFRALRHLLDKPGGEDVSVVVERGFKRSEQLLG
jgi:hypothetical protein